MFWHERDEALGDGRRDARRPPGGDLRLAEPQEWDLLSKWGPLPPVGGQYEVPDLFPLNVDGNPSRQKWVMIISTNPGGLWGGSLTAAYIGEFDGTTFKEDARYGYAGAPGTTTFADFERADYGTWTATGTAFGDGPTQGALDGSAVGQRLQGAAPRELVPRRRRQRPGR